MRLSVVIPAYNRADLLPRTLDSVLAQTRPPAEIVVVDDGSTDGTHGVVAGYGPRVAYRRQDNAGQGAARNAGQVATTGDALLFLDSDDLLLPPALESLEAALAAEPEAALAYGRARVIDAAGKVVRPLWEAEEGTGRKVWRLLAQKNFIASPGCALVRRKHLEAVGPWDADRALQGVEDWDLWLRVAENGAPFVRVPEVFLEYRVHPDNISGQASRMRAREIALYEKHLARAGNDPDRLGHLQAIYDAVRRQTVWDRNGAPQPRLQGRHRALRGLLEGAALAPLYRRLPFGLRLRLRALFGVDRRA